MLQVERRKAILDRLKKAESVTIPDMAKLCNVSEITIRRDMDELGSRGLLIRTHGGATNSQTGVNLFSFEEKATSRKDEKMRICRKASSFISDDDTIYIDCGSTVYYLTHYLSLFRNLKVVTNSLPIVSALIRYPEIQVFLIGGELDHKRQALYSSLIDKSISRYRADKAFIGAAGITMDAGLHANDEKEALTTYKMAQSAEEVFLLADSSKMDKAAFVHYAGMDLIDHIITDKDANNSFTEHCKTQGVHVHVV